jgi:hypothetical protein
MQDIRTQSIEDSASQDFFFSETYRFWVKFKI